jgi:hypothetical protein
VVVAVVVVVIIVVCHCTKSPKKVARPRTACEMINLRPKLVVRFHSVVDWDTHEIRNLRCGSVSDSRIRATGSSTAKC